MFSFVLPAVAPHAASLSPAPLLVSAGDDILATAVPLVTHSLSLPSMGN